MSQNKGNGRRKSSRDEEILRYINEELPSYEESKKARKNNAAYDDEEYDDYDDYDDEPKMRYSERMGYRSGNANTEVDMMPIIKMVALGLCCLTALIIIIIMFKGCSSDKKSGAVAKPTATQAPTAIITEEPSISVTEEPSSTPTQEPTEEVTATPSPTDTPTPSPEPTNTPTPSPSPLPTATPMPTATPTPTATPEPTRDPNMTATPTPTKKVIAGAVVIPSIDEDPSLLKRKIDVHLVDEEKTVEIWASLNDNGIYYDKNGRGFRNNGDGTMRGPDGKNYICDWASL